MLPLCYTTPCKVKLNVTDEDEQLPEPSGTPVDVSAWKELFVPEPILDALKELGFQEPTPIQRQTLPAAIKGRKDIVGAAETGSGSNPSFGLLIFHLNLCYF